MKLKIKTNNAKKQKPAIVDNRPMKPTISFDEDQVKGLLNCKVDQECELELKVKVLSVGRSQWDNKKLSVNFEILSGSMETEDEPENTTEARNSIVKKMKD